MLGRLLTFVLLASTSVPAGAQIFYNKGADERAKAALDEYRASRDAHLRIFKTRRDALATRGRALDDAIAGAIRAERDWEVAELLELQPAAQTIRVTRKVDERLLQITGLSYGEIQNAILNGGSANGLLLAKAGLEVRDKSGLLPPQIPSGFTFDEKNAKKWLSSYPSAYEKLSGTTGAGKGTMRAFCEQKVISSPLNNNPVKSAGEVLAVITPLGIARPVDVALVVTGICGSLVTHIRSDAARQDSGANSALRALAGYALPIDDPMPMSESVRLGQDLTRLQARLDEADAEIDTQKARAEELKKNRKAVKDAAEAAAKSGAKATVTDAAAGLARAIGKAPDNAAIGKACEGELTLSCAREVAEALGAVSFDRLRASVAVEIAGYLADPVALAQAAKDKCGTVPASEEAKRVCLAHAGLETLRVLDQANEVSSGRPGQLAELAILITDAESRVADAQAKSTALIREIGNLDAQRRALVGEAELLRQARLALAANVNDPRAAVLILARSYEEGRLTYQQNADRAQLLKLEGFNDREEEAVTGRYAIVDGLLQTVSSATAAGLKPEDAARFLAAIGVTTLGISEAVK